MNDAKFYRVFESHDGGFTMTQVKRYDLQSKPKLLYDFNDSLLNVYESDFIFDPVIPETNKVSIYIKIFDVNIVGILFDTVESMEKYVRFEELTYYVDEMVTYGHYLQMMNQSDKIYWNTKTPIFYFSEQTPFVGAMEIRVMKKNDKFIALIRVCDC